MAVMMASSSAVTVRCRIEGGRGSEGVALAGLGRAERAL